jgi:hypothetical protein
MMNILSIVIAIVVADLFLMSVRAALHRIAERKHR